MTRSELGLNEIRWSAKKMEKIHTYLNDKKEVGWG